MDHTTLQTELALAPAASVLNSMLLIDAAGRMPALDPWAARTAAALSEPLRHRHRLVCALLKVEERRI